MKKRILSVMTAALLLLPSLTVLGGCAENGKAELVLRVYNWEEYIDEGGEGSYIYDLLAEEGEEPDEDDAPSLISDFEAWYPQTHGGQTIKVEYSTFGTNEDMYNEIVLGNEYDLICPSDYMIMKLAAENRLVKYDESFFDPTVEENYYIKNVSPFIQKKFEENAGLKGKDYSWSEYAAGYMWGTTGFVYNPEAVSEEELKRLDWQVFLEESEAFTHKITAKDNVRDTYFAALGVAFEDELKALRAQFLEGSLSQEAYTERITEIFNATDEETIAIVEPYLERISQNIHSFETDTGKADLVKGVINLNYAWSGDAIYAMDLAEEENDMEFNYFVPAAGSNLWFDGWVMPRGVIDRGTKEAAQAFVNFLSMPENAKRNSYYIGYTSVISGENMEMLDYADYLYSYEFDPESEEEPEETVDYDLSWFFGGEASITASRVQAEKRQLYAQFPPEDVMSRCAVMDYYADEDGARINELWSRIQSGHLDTWAILVICLTVIAIALFTVFVKFGGKIDFFRPKPKKGYYRIDSHSA